MFKHVLLKGIFFIILLVHPAFGCGGFCDGSFLDFGFDIGGYEFDLGWGGMYHLGGYDFYQSFYGINQTLLELETITTVYLPSINNLIPNCGGGLLTLDPCFGAGVYGGGVNFGGSFGLLPLLPIGENPVIPVTPPSHPVVPPSNLVPFPVPPMPQPVITPPSYGYVPRDPGMTLPPPQVPIWGGCDGIVVPCPIGPVDRPVPQPSPIIPTTPIGLGPGPIPNGPNPGGIGMPTYNPISSPPDRHDVGRGFIQQTQRRLFR